MAPSRPITNSVTPILQVSATVPTTPPPEPERSLTLPVPDAAPAAGRATLPDTEPVSFWLVPLPAAHASPVDLATLTPQEQQRAAEFRAPRAHGAFVTTRAALRRVLGHHLGVPPDRVPLTVTSRGKPVLTSEDIDARPAVWCNVTHCSGLGIVALHPVLPVGVDVEVADRRIGAGVVARLCTPRERDLLAALAPSRRQAWLLRLWVRKEAIAKADGRGLALGATRLEASDEGPVRLPPNRDTNDLGDNDLGDNDLGTNGPTPTEQGVGSHDPLGMTPRSTSSRLEHLRAEVAWVADLTELDHLGDHVDLGGLDAIGAVATLYRPAPIVLRGILQPGGA